MKTAERKQRHLRVRAKIAGTAERPRLVVFRGTKTIAAQLVDDQAGKVLATATNQSKKGGKVSADAATHVGAALAKKATTLKISSVVFDRAGYAYHGAVKAVAEAVREAGVKV